MCRNVRGKLMIINDYYFLHAYDPAIDKTPVVSVFEQTLKDGIWEVASHVETHKYTLEDCHWIDNREGATFLGGSSFEEWLASEDKDWQKKLPPRIVEQLKTLPEYDDMREEN